MQRLTRDILVTLTLKVILLYALWYVCCKDVTKPSWEPNQWFLGKQSKVESPKHDSRQ